MAYPPAPPLLLTRRLSSFLHSSLESLREQHDSSLLAPGAAPSSTTLQTALLVTPSGKLLAYESPLPVRTLRTHCSVAASLWAIHASSAPSVSVALNQRPQPHNVTHPQQVQLQQQQQQQQQSQNYFQQQNQSQPPTQQADEDDGYHDGSAPVSIAASFNGGAVFVVRKLRCGLLFACSTPAPNNPTGSRPSTATVDPSSVTALPISVSSEAAQTPGLPATAITTPSSLLPHSTLPILPKPTAAGSSDGTATPNPIAVPSKQSPHNAGAGELVGSLIPGSAATAETYETAHTGGEHGSAPNDSLVADRDANADAASMMTTTTIGAGAGGALSGGRGPKYGSVTATLAVARRQVDELARLLDEKLGTLTVPDDNIGLNGFC